jgi:predicted dehydrogenase
MPIKRIVPTGKIRLAVLGMGQRSTHMAKMICDADDQVEVVAAVDPAAFGASERAQKAELRGARTIRYYDEVESLLAHADDFDALLIGTQCHLHAPLAIAVAETDLPLFLEKPVAISWEQHRALAKAYEGRESSVVVSFPLRMTQHVQVARDIIRSGRLGVVNQIQAVNNVPYGGVYFGQWYREYEKTGGLWLQKATHDLDYVNHLMSASVEGTRPVQIAAMHSRAVYGGTLPPDLRCSKCDRTEVCPESPQNLVQRGSDGGVLNHTTPQLNSDHACTFSSGILNQDAGSAMVMYSSGAHASYSQNFLTRLSAGRRGATVTGYEATLQFDWQSDAITVIDHHRSRVDRIEVGGVGLHGGGDAALAQNFVNLLRGRDVSASTLHDGLLSVAMCLAARDAADQGTTQSIAAFGKRSLPLVNVTPRGPVEPANSATATGYPLPIAQSESR